MRFYRLHVRRMGGESDGYEWFTNARDASRRRSELNHGVEEADDRTGPAEDFDIEPSKDGIVRALNKFASYPDNG